MTSGTRVYFHIFFLRFRNIDLNLLIALEKKHWQTGNLTDDMSKTFAFNSLFFWPYNIVHTITFLMFVTDARNHPIKVNAQILNEASKLIVFLLVIVYCGWTGSLLSKEVTPFISIFFFLIYSHYSVRNFYNGRQKIVLK